MSGTGVIFAIGDGDYLPYIQIQAMGFIVQVPTFCCQLAGIRINGKIGRSLLSKSKVKSSPASSSVARNTSPMFSPLPLCSHPLCEWCGARLPHSQVEVRCAVHHCIVIGGIVGEPDNDAEFVVGSVGSVGSFSIGDGDYHHIVSLPFIVQVPSGQVLIGCQLAASPHQC